MTVVYHETISIGPIGKGKLLVLSDLHVGDPRQHPGVLAALMAVMDHEAPDYIVVAGDVLEGNLATDQQIDQLRTICQRAPARLLLQGNHDRQETADLAVSLDCAYPRVLIGKSGEREFAIEHGDRFDPTWSRSSWLGKVGVWLNRMVYRIFHFDTQTWLRTKACVYRKLLLQQDRAWKHWGDKSIVVTGHTHLPTNAVHGSGYCNSGDWLTHRSYCVIQDGTAVLRHAQNS